VPRWLRQTTLKTKEGVMSDEKFDPKTYKPADGTPLLEATVEDLERSIAMRKECERAIADSVLAGVDGALDTFGEWEGGDA
jgi:hypothetical protein